MSAASAMGRSAAIVTFGCQMNKFDSERLRGILSAAGYAIEVDPMEADLVVFNTCCVRENADDRLYGRLGALRPVKKRRPELQIAVGGCLAQKDKDVVLEKAPHVDVVFGTHNAAELPAMLDEARGGRGVVSVPVTGLSAEEEAMSEYRQERTRAWLPITIGCDNHCTYCIVPSVRGSERSVPMPALIRRCQELVADGALDITLLGQNVNSYGADLADGVDFAKLIRAVDSEAAPSRIRFATSHPKDFGDDIISALAESGSVCRHIHLPVQAGSDRILAAMGRGYSSDWYLGRVRAIRQAMPDAAITTDLIIGFPGETEEDFSATLELVDEVGYDAAYTFIYSPRSGTPAAEMEGRITSDEAAERMKRLLARLKPLTDRAMQRYLDQEVEVLVEGPSRKDPGLLTGRTRENKLVHFKGSDALIDTLAIVYIDEAYPWSLRGRLKS